MCTHKRRKSSYSRAMASRMERGLLFCVCVWEASRAKDINTIVSLWVRQRLGSLCAHSLSTWDDTLTGTSEESGKPFALPKIHIFGNSAMYIWLSIR